MNANEILFIRACKSPNPEKRLKSLIKRAYICTEDSIEFSTLIALTDIVHKYELCNIREALFAFQGRPYSEFLTPTQKIIDFCIYKIRFRAVDFFSERGYKVPARVRNGKY